jgi:hypothetical protein
MRSSSLRRGGKWLAAHVNRLRQTLDALGRRLRDTVATAVGQTVALAVREAVHAALTDFSGAPAARQAPAREPDPARSLWSLPDDADADPWPGGPGDLDPDDFGPDLPDLRDPSDPRAAPARDPKPEPRWPLAVVVGCQAAAWWLKRRLARLPVLAAVAVGVLAAVATYAGGPLTLAGSALGLAGTASALGVFGPS